MVDFTNCNSLAASLLVETWARLGVEQAVICPGSRSSPLTVAFARHSQIDCVVSLDERSASFFALGYGKRTGKPAILLCTSGTAAANFFPAIVEAQAAQVPLLVLTGDRPPRLRHCHGGQTIDQTKLYGAYPQWQAELALPEANWDYCHYLRQTAVQAWQRCFWPRLGVVHLNCPFDEPLAPLADDSVTQLKNQFDSNQFYRGLREGAQGASQMSNLFTPPPSPAQAPRSATLTSRPLTKGRMGGVFPKGDRPGLQLFPGFNLVEITNHFWPDFTKTGLIVVGFLPGGEREEFLQALLAIARVLNYPILCDALSSLRNYADGEVTLITYYDFLLRDVQTAETLTPEWILQIGELPTSKQLRNWLANINCPRYILQSQGENLDPLHGQTLFLPHTVQQLQGYLTNLNFTPTSKQQDYTQLWVNTQRCTAEIIQSTLNSTNWNAPQLVAQLPPLLPPQTNLFIANSLPIRWLEFFWGLNNHHHHIFVNRGANGIDGTLSTAMGVAHRSPNPTVLLTGDLSLLHDSNGFLNQGQFQGQLTIILLNNNGGGIFEILPIVDCEDVFEQYFATPQTIDFAQLCCTYNVTHKIIKTKQALQTALAEKSPTPIQVLEISGDRRQEAQWLRTLQNQFCR